MKRRGRGEGSIHHRPDGLWQGAISTPEGRRFCYARTEADCIAAVRQMQQNVLEGRPAAPSRQTLASFLEDWLEEVVRVGCRPRVHRRYQEIVRLHIAPALGTTQLRRLTPRQVQQLYNRLAAHLSPRSVRHVHEVLHNALEVARARWRLISHNPAEGATLPPITTEAPVPLTLAQARDLVAAIAHEPHEALYLLAITTGLRQSELLGLRWEDIHLAEPSGPAGALDPPHLHVRRNVQRVPGLGWIEDRPKSRASRRTIGLTPLAVDALQRHAVRQQDLRRAAGPLWAEADLVFPNSRGRPIEPGNLTTRSYRPMLQRAGLPPIRFHALRHSAASLLVALGADPAVVQAILGHANVSTTLALYTHQLPSAHHHAIRQMQAALQPSDESPDEHATNPPSRLIAGQKERGVE